MPELHLLTGAYALDALEDVERAGFERHLRSCGNCAAEVIEFQEVAARLSGRMQLAPPERLRFQVLSAANRTRQVCPPGWTPLRRPSLRRVLATACAAALIAGSAGLAGVAWRGHQAARDAVFAADRAGHRATQVADVMTDPQRSEVVQLIPSGGTATLVAARGTAVLVTRDLPALPSTKTYQVWLFDTKGVNSVELLKLRAGGGQSLVTGVQAGSSVAVSVEPAGGSRQPTTSPVLNLLVA